MNPWQGIGGFVYTAANLTARRLDQLKSLGSQCPWVCIVIYGDDVAGPANQSSLQAMKTLCKARGIQTWGWYNGWGGDPYEDARNISRLHTTYQLDGIILDLEAAYQYPGGDANKMPFLVSSLRNILPNAQIGVSTNGMNSSMIWNGRVLNPKRSFYDLKIRCLPQWYSSYYNKDAHTQPQYQMRWLKDNGSSDFNFRDENAIKTKYRGLPLSFVHGTLEVTGLENSSLQAEIEDCVACRIYGLTPGISLYTLENMPDSDFDILARHRGVVYL